MDKKEFLKDFEQLENIPTLPTVTTRLLNLKRKTVPMRKVAGIIEADPSLTADILKIANSAYYGSPQRINNLNLALVKLGLDEIFRIVLQVTVIKSFKGINSPYFDMNNFWMHSAIVAFLSTKIMEEFNIKGQNQVYTAALCHDIGKLIMLKLYQEKFNKIITFVAKNHVSSFIAEKKIIGVSHSEVGAWLFEYWNFPRSLIDPILNHHHPQKSSGNNQIAAVLSLADYIAHKMKISPFKITINMFVPRIAINLLKQNNRSFDFSQFQRSLMPQVTRTKRKLKSIFISAI